MKKTFLIFLIGIVFVIYAGKLDFIDQLNLTNATDLLKLDQAIKNDTMILPMINSHLNLSTPVQRLYKYIIIVSKYRYKNAFYPLKAILEHKIESHIEMAALSYFLHLNTPQSNQFLKNYLLKLSKFKDIHYLILSQFFNNFSVIEQTKIVNKILDNDQNKELAALFFIQYYNENFKNMIIKRIIKSDNNLEKYSYILYFLAPRLSKKDIVKLYNSIKKNKYRATYILSILLKTNYYGIKKVKHLERKGKGEVKLIAKNKYDEFMKILSIKWVKQKIQYFNVQRNDEFNNLYKQILNDNTYFNFTELVAYSSLDKIEKLLQIEQIYAKNMDDQALKEIELINDLILILKISPYVSSL